MAKITEMTFHKNLKLGQSYNSSGLGFSVTVSVDDDDDVVEVRRKAWEMVDEQIGDQVVEIVKILNQLGD